MGEPDSSGHGNVPVPGPGSAFHVPPPSNKSLRWSIVFCLIVPSVLALAAVEAALAHEWTPLVIGVLLMFCAYSLLKFIQIRAILQELARRRGVDSSGGSGSPTSPERAVDAQEEARRRKAAWARVRHDLFPILSNPAVLKRPFENWDDWKDS